MNDDPNRVWDGWSNLTGGMDQGRRAHLIDGTQVNYSQNSVFRGGDWQQRPPFIDQVLSYENPDTSYAGPGWYNDNAVPGQSKTNFESGLFQGVHYYSLGRGDEHMAVMIGGRLYILTPGTNGAISVRETAIDYRNNATLPMAFFVQVGPYTVIQDGQSRALIFDGMSTRRAAQDEIPVGTIMAYGQGRIVLIRNSRMIEFGNLFNSKGFGFADSLGWDENSFIAEVGVSALPPGMGDPTGIVFLPQQDAATGVGDCIVFGENGAEGFSLSLPRDTWQTSQFQREVLREIGCVGHRFIALINNDIWFGSKDGWRIYRQARAEIAQFAHIPFSTNVKEYVNRETTSLRKFGSLIEFDNRLIGTTTPIPNQGKLYHNGLLSIDCDILATFGSATAPAWDGHWADRAGDPTVGARVTQLVKGTFNGEPRCFAFILDSTGKNAVIEISRFLEGSDSAGQITSTLRSRAMFTTRPATTSTRSSPFDESSLYSGELWIADAKEAGAIAVDHRPDQIGPEFGGDAPFWHEWGSVPFAPIEEVTLGGLPVTVPGHFPKSELASPSDDADDFGSIALPAKSANRILRRGFEHQVQLKMTGRASVRKARFGAQQEYEH